MRPIGLALAPGIVRLALILTAAFACGASTVAAAGPADAKPTAAGAREAEPPLVQRLVVRLRPGIHPEDGARLSGRRLADLQMAAGLDFTVDAPTRGGDQVLVLPGPVSPSEAKAIARTLRMRPEVLRADVERASRTPADARARGKLAADAVTVRRFIVTFADPAMQERARNNQKLAVDADRLLTEVAGIPLRVVRATVGGAWVVETFAPVSGARAREIAAKLEAHPAIKHASPDLPMRAQAAFHPNDLYYYQGYQWNLDDPVSGSYYGIDAAQAWAITVGSNAVTVAVVDTGIIAHPDLAGRVFGGYDFISDADSARDGDDRDPNPTDWGTYGSASECDGDPVKSGWHGSHVAGIIGATGNNGYGIAGVDWLSKLIAVRVLGACGSGTSVDINEGMAWAAGLPVPGVPPNPLPARVINMSLGGSGECSDQRQALIDESMARGALIVVAAGNESESADLHTPANCYGVSTVVATDPYGYRASYSNYSIYADISAPGGDSSRYTETDAVLSTVESSENDPTGDYTFGYKNGTSMATPHVSGVASLMLSVNPTLTPAQIKGIMADTSSYFASDSVCRTDNDCGAGIVNAHYAVLEAIRIQSVPKIAVIEYYNPQLDHYFIIGQNQPGVAALDSGAIPGWTRTGYTFNAYAGPESGFAPVCRFYIPPEHGNSHFYSASQADCDAVYDAANNPANPAHASFSGYVYETGAAFYLDTPVDGTCPPTRVAVFRLWNRRVDSNHRYTANPSIRAQMLGRGYADEGVVMCALP